MRKIKYRIWDKDIKKFFNFELQAEDAFIKITGEGQADLQRFWLIKSPLSKYVGLDDKNGKEIYEGDIINVKFPNGGRNRAVVEWHEHGFAYKAFRALDDSIDSRPLANIGFPHYSRFSECSYEYEIIGNIYENPELLK